MWLSVIFLMKMFKNLRVGATLADMLRHKQKFMVYELYNL